MDISPGLTIERREEKVGADQLRTDCCGAGEGSTIKQDKTNFCWTSSISCTAF